MYSTENTLYEFVQLLSSSYEDSKHQKEIHSRGPTNLDGQPTVSQLSQVPFPFAGSSDIAKSDMVVGHRFFRVKRGAHY